MRLQSVSPRTSSGYLSPFNRRGAWGVTRSYACRESQLKFQSMRTDQPLPPKSQIKSIHVTRDGFAAENHNAGAFFVDIVTQPGIGPIRGQTFYHIRDGSMTGGCCARRRRRS